MASMPAHPGQSEACCNVPAVVAAESYDAKGSYEDIGGLKTYLSGPSDATKGIVVVYDIFGFTDQTIQGADIMGQGDDKQQYRVVIPDWTKGGAYPIEWYPPKTTERQDKLKDWFKTWAPDSVAQQIPTYLDALKAKYPAVTSWATMGYCWGGKVVTLAAATPGLVSAAAAAHPAMVSAQDAAAIKTPFCLLASKDEDPQEVESFENALKGPKYVETFGDQIHGWMAARADLSDDRVRAEYLRGYKTVLKFFGNHV